MLDVERERGTIRVTSELYIDAPQALVFDVLADYEQLPRMSSRFRESRVEQDTSGVTWVYTLVEGCVWFFCRSLERHARLETDRPHTISAVVDPSRSDFATGIEHWSLHRENDTTVVRYTHELDPKFWFPPVIGEWAIRRTLREDALKAASRIERLAAADAR